MNKIASDLFDVIGSWLSKNPSWLNGALAGGAVGGLGGALFTGKGTKLNETASERMLRRLKNAIMLGAAGAGAGALVPLGLSAFKAEDFIPSTPAAEDSGSSSGNTINDKNNTLGAALGGAADQVSGDTWDGLVRLIGGTLGYKVGGSVNKGLQAAGLYNNKLRRAELALGVPEGWKGNAALLQDWIDTVGGKGLKNGTVVRGQINGSDLAAARRLASVVAEPRNVKLLKSLGVDVDAATASKLPPEVLRKFRRIRWGKWVPAVGLRGGGAAAGAFAPEIARAIYDAVAD